MNEKNVMNVSWNDINKIVESFSEQLSGINKPDCIVTIQRGGLIPAVMLSHKINVRDIIVIDARITIDDEINSCKGVPVLKKNIALNTISNKKIVIIDDILGSGETLNLVLNYIEKFNPIEVKTFVCFLNEMNFKNSQFKGEFLLNNTVIGKMVDRWVMFPWE